MRTLDGELKGRHDGLMYYTLGQRQGLGIGGSGSGEPWFVAGKDLERNVLYVVQGEKHPALYSKGLLATDLTWISGEPPQSPFRCTAKFRYRQPDQGVIVHFEADAAAAWNSISLRRRLRRDNPSCSMTAMSAWAERSSTRW